MDTRKYRDNSANGHRRRVPSFKTGSCQQIKSHKSDNDDNNHETIIYQQLHGASGPCENIMVNQTDTNWLKTFQAKRKRCHDVQDDEEETTFGQQPAKNPKLGSSDFENLAISGLTKAMANLKPVNTKPASSFSTSSRKRQFKPDNDDDNHEPTAKIRQQLYYPGEPCENMMVNHTENESHCSIAAQVKHKRWQVDQGTDEEMPFAQQSAKNLDYLLSLKKEFVFLPSLGWWSIRVSITSLACFFYLTFFRQLYLESLFLSLIPRPLDPPNSDNV